MEQESDSDDLQLELEPVKDIHDYQFYLPEIPIKLHRYTPIISKHIEDGKNKKRI